MVGEENIMNTRDFGIEEQNRIISELANTCSQLVRMNGGKLGDAAEGIDGALVSPPLDVRGVELYIGKLNAFRPMITFLN